MESQEDQLKEDNNQALSAQQLKNKKKREKQKLKKAAEKAKALGQSQTTDGNAGQVSEISPGANGGAGESGNSDSEKQLSQSEDFTQETNSQTIEAPNTTKIAPVESEEDPLLARNDTVKANAAPVIKEEAKEEVKQEVAQEEAKKEELPIKDEGDQGKDATSEKGNDNSHTQEEESKLKDLDDIEATHSEGAGQEVPPVIEEKKEDTQPKAAAESASQDAIHQESRPTPLKKPITEIPDSQPPNPSQPSTEPKQPEEEKETSPKSEKPSETLKESEERKSEDSQGEESEQTTTEQQTNEVPAKNGETTNIVGNTVTDTAVEPKESEDAEDEFKQEGKKQDSLHSDHDDSGDKSQFDVINSGDIEKESALEENKEDSQANPTLPEHTNKHGEQEVDTDLEDLTQLSQTANDQTIDKPTRTEGESHREDTVSHHSQEALPPSQKLITPSQETLPSPKEALPPSQQDPPVSQQIPKPVAENSVNPIEESKVPADGQVSKTVEEKPIDPSKQSDSHADGKPEEKKEEIIPPPVKQQDPSPQKDDKAQEEKKVPKKVSDKNSSGSKNLIPQMYIEPAPSSKKVKQTVNGEDDEVIEQIKQTTQSKKKGDQSKQIQNKSTAADSSASSQPNVSQATDPNLAGKNNAKVESPPAINHQAKIQDLECVNFDLEKEKKILLEQLEKEKKANEIKLIEKDKQLSSKDALIAEEIKKTAAAHEEAKKAAEDHKAKEVALNKQIEDLQKANSDEKLKHQAEMDGMNRQLRATQEETVKEREMAMDNEKEISELVQQKEAQEKDFQQREQQHVERFENLVKKHSEEITQLKEDHKSELAQLKKEQAEKYRRVPQI